MRPIIESTLMSIDGVVEAPWAWVDFDAEAKALARANLDSYDGFLFGRGAFEQLGGSWQQIHGDPYIDAINAAPKYVVSDTLPDDPGWNAEVVRGGAASVAALREMPGRPLVKYGNGRLTGGLLAHGLLDVIQLWIVPVRVGTGRRLFEHLDGPAPRLTLTGTRELASGIVVLDYAVGDPPVR